MTAMYELFWAPGTAAMAPQTVLEEIGAEYRPILLDLAARQHEQADYRKLNPNGRVPTLVDGDFVIFETAAICQYLCDKHPETKLAPAPGSHARGRFYQWLTYMTNTVQVGFLDWFHPDWTFAEPQSQAALKTQVDTIEWATGKAIPDDAYAQLEANSRNSVAPYFSGVGAFVFMPIVTLFFAALFWGLFNALLGGTATFKQVLGVVAHSTVIMALGAAISVPIQLMQTTFSLAGPFNLGALVPMLDPDSFVKKLLSATSAITIWQTIVVAIGLGVLYKRKSTGIAIGLLVAYGALVAIGVSLFSALMSRMGS